MSFIDGLKETGKNIVTRFAERIAESESFAQLNDRYQNLSPSGQKAARYGAVAMALLIVALIPMTKFSESSLNVSAFEEKRNLIRELFKTYRESSAGQALPAPPAPDSLRAAVENVLQQADLLPEQKIETLDATPEGNLIPKNLIGGVLSVRLAKLNLKQIVDIGASIASISDSIKLKDMDIKQNSQTEGYYDVTYKIYTLKVPEPTPEPPPAPPEKSSRGKSKKSEGSDE